MIADRTGRYGGSETFWCGSDGVWKDVWLSPEPPAAAKTVVWKIGSDKPFVGVARWDSYKQESDVYKNNQPTGEKKLTNLWEKMPDTMLGKCSESLALRKAFPAELSGLYTREEMAQADSVDHLEQPQSELDILRTTFNEAFNRATSIDTLEKLEGWLDKPKQAKTLAKYPDTLDGFKALIADTKKQLEQLQNSTQTSTEVLDVASQEIPF